MLLVLDLGLSSLVLVISLLAIPLIGFVVRRQWRLAALRREEIRRLLIHASEEAARVEREASVEFSFAPVANSFYCPVCYCPAFTRCSRCKAVRYCSGKCQIIHWRQGHKDECQPASITYNTDDEKSDSDLKCGEGNEGLTRDETVLLHSEAATGPIREAIISEPARSSEDVSGESADNKDDLIDKEEAVSVAETSGSSFSGFSSSPRGDSSDDTSLGECLSSSDSERSEPLLDAHVSVAAEETCFSNIDDVPSKPLSPKFVHLVESVDNLASLPKLNLLKPEGGAGQNQSQSSSLLGPDRLPGSADPSLLKSSDFWGTALGSAECVIENRDSSKSREPGKSSLHISFAPSRDTSAGKVSEHRNFISEETPRAASGSPNFHDEVNRNERIAKRSDEAGISLSSSSSIKAPLPLNPTGLSTLTLRKSKSTSTGSGVVLAPLKVGEVQVLASKTTKARESPDVVKHSAVGADSGRVIDHQKKNGVAVRRINSLNGKSGLKASVLKVVDQWTKPKSLAENEMAGRHGHKGLFSYELFVKLYTNKTELQPCGLINSGNSCFANVVFQCLMFTPPLTTYFLQQHHSRACPNKEQCFTCGFENLVLEATEGKSSLSPSGLLSRLQNIGISLGNGKQEDAHEFLRFVVDTMQTLCIKASEYDEPKTRKLEDTTLIGLTFGGYLRSKIKCMKCQEKSERREKMMDLTVEIDGDISTLEDALRRFTRTEILDGENKYKCGRCKSYERAKKKLKIIEPPNVLTIALKRFQSGKFGKLNKLVRFPETLDLAPYVSGGSEKSHDYKLYGVIVHLDVMNAAFSGHYVCYIRNSQNKWYKADDNTVVTSDVERVLTKGAYMLFYARCSPMPPRLVVCNKTEASTNKKRSVPPPVPKTTVSRSVSTASPVCSSNTPGGDRSGNIQSFYSSFQRLQRILEEDSSSDSSSLFDSNSDECSCSTDSTSMDEMKMERKMNKTRVFTILSLLVFAFSFDLSNALYGSSSPVLQLTPSNFKSKVINSNGVVLVEFFAPWCGHCKSLTPTWEKVATTLKGIATVAAIDADAHKSVSQDYGVRGFPTIKVFVPGKPPIDYQGARDAKAISQFAIKQIKALLKDRLDGKTTGTNTGGGSSEKKSEPSASVELNSSNFDELVTESKDLWIVEFFAPWCGHCKKLAPEWKKAAKNLKGKVKLGHVDCDADKAIQSRFKVKGFPTILVFGADKSSPLPYEGARSASAIESFALEQLEANAGPAEVTELTGPDSMEEKCGPAAICFVSFLPDILDSKAEGRNKYLEMLLSVAEKFKKDPISFVWVAAGKQPDLEKRVGVGGYGYPAMVALNAKKGAYAPLKSGFEVKHLIEFVKEAQKGGKGNLPIDGTLEIVKTEAWDGKDGEVVDAEEFSLEELMADD